MGKVIKIGIAPHKGAKINGLNSIDVIQGKGIIGDRTFKENNGLEKQITLIEIENINNYNNLLKTSIEPLDFRRNIITEGISLNDLVGCEFYIGKIKIKAHDLCRPCKYLQDTLKQRNIIREFLLKGGLRCEILSSGKINVGDIITQK
tara:strand:+ start:1916 stop:2359 length:444 start_codon:yes stop_codon:yes gene_type:complete